MQCIPDFSGQSLVGFVQDTVEHSESIVMTDGWRRLTEAFRIWDTDTTAECSLVVGNPPKLVAPCASCCFAP